MIDPKLIAEQITGDPDVPSEKYSFLKSILKMVDAPRKKILAWMRSKSPKQIEEINDKAWQMARSKAKIEGQDFKKFYYPALEVILGNKSQEWFDQYKTDDPAGPLRRRSSSGPNHNPIDDREEEIAQKAAKYARDHDMNYPSALAIVRAQSERRS